MKFYLFISYVLCTLFILSQYNFLLVKIFYISFNFIKSSRRTFISIIETLTVIFGIETLRPSSYI